MALISVANLKNYTDKIAIAWETMQAVCGTISGDPVAGTLRGLADNLEVLVASTMADYHQQADLGDNVNVFLNSAGVELILAKMGNAVTQLDSHCSNRGELVDGDIVSLATYLAYYNDASKFSALLHPSFGEAWSYFKRADLDPSALFHPGIHPDLDSDYASGLGTRAVGGAFVAGGEVDTDTYSEVTLLAEVTVNFAGGGAPPTLSVSGTDDLGDAQTWSATLDSNNPSAALATTLTEGYAAYTRGSVAVGSSAGMVVGSVLVVGAGTVNQEAVVVEAVPDGTHVTVAFRKAHGTGESVTGKRSYVLAPADAGRRCRSVSGLTIGISAHSAGTIRLIGVQDRGGDPS